MNENEKKTSGNSETKKPINQNEDILLRKTSIQDAQILERLFCEKGINLDQRLVGREVELFVKLDDFVEAQAFLIAADSRVIHEKAKAKAIKKGKKIEPSLDYKEEDEPTKKHKMTLGTRVVLTIIFLGFIAGAVFLTDFVIKLVQGLF